MNLDVPDNIQENDIQSFEVVAPGIIQCPQCRNYRLPQNFNYDISLSRGANFIKHLLECIEIKSTGISRHKLIKAILNNFHEMSQSGRRNHVHINGLIERLFSRDNYYRNNISFMEAEIPEMSQCPICNEYFTNSQICCYHLFTQCLVSENDSNRGTELWIYLRNYFSEKPECLRTLCILYGVIQHGSFTCKYCGVDVDELMVHQEDKHSEPFIFDGVICFVCNFIAPDNEALAEHAFSQHRLEIKNSGRQFKCRVCETEPPFRSEEEFKQHVSDCTPQKRLLNIDSVIYEKCTFCFLKILVTDMDRHLKTHGDENPPRSTEMFCTSINLDNLLRYKELLTPEDSEKLKMFLIN